MLVYKATSQTTNKVYIGITTNTLEYRMAQHKRAAEEGKQYHFYEAIRKYGFDDFIFEIVENNINDYEYLKEREIYWIKHYNSYENGYNSTRGGEGALIRDDQLILKLFNEGKEVKEICQITGYNRSTIYQAFKNLHLTEENNKRKHLKTQQRCSMPVLQYDLNGKFIKEWPSATSLNEKYSQSAISSVCRQEQFTAYGYVWKYKHDERSINEWLERLKTKRSGGRPKKPILQLDDNFKVIQEYESASAAAKAIGKTDKSNICAAARNHKKAYGYYWQYKFETIKK